MTTRISPLPFVSFSPFPRQRARGKEGEKEKEEARRRRKKEKKKDTHLFVRLGHEPVRAQHR
jgi:hypothetical protein